jgi:hypothetical protein
MEHLMDQRIHEQFTSHVSVNQNVRLATHRWIGLAPGFGNIRESWDDAQQASLASQAKIQMPF